MFDLYRSFSAPARSYCWDDSLNQAVMAAWQAGIVVVASAGNTGSEPMTIGVPGNVACVITVGAMTDNYTPDDPSDDAIATFSSAGPTVEGFVKPDLVAPGGHVYGMMDWFARIAKDLAGEKHYAGLFRRDADGNYYMETIEGQSMLWSDSMLRADSMLWSDSMLWADALTEPVAINVWVTQE